MRAPQTAPDGAGEARNEMVRWAALGDSFSAGTASIEPSWTELVCERLAPARALRVFNLAQVGATIEAIASEQLPQALEAEPDLLTLLGGGNDVIGTVRPDLERLEVELDRLWADLRRALPDTTLLTATYPTIGFDALRPRTRERVERGLAELNSAVRQIATRYGVRCVELADHPGELDPSNYAADGIHPSPAGHRATAAVLGPAIEELTSRSNETSEEAVR